MTDKILELAKKILGTVLINGTEYFELDESGFEELANLIRADERNECAKICEDITRYAAFQSKEHYKVTSVCAQRIRER